MVHRPDCQHATVYIEYGKFKGDHYRSNDETVLLLLSKLILQNPESLLQWWVSVLLSKPRL